MEGREGDDGVKEESYQPLRSIPLLPFFFFHRRPRMKRATRRLHPRSFSLLEILNMRKGTCGCVRRMRPRKKDGEKREWRRSNRLLFPSLDPPPPPPSTIFFTCFIKPISLVLAPSSSSLPRSLVRSPASRPSSSSFFSSGAKVLLRQIMYARAREGGGTPSLSLLFLPFSSSAEHEEGWCTIRKGREGCVQ